MFFGILVLVVVFIYILLAGIYEWVVFEGCIKVVFGFYELVEVILVGFFDLFKVFMKVFIFFIVVVIMFVVLVSGIMFGIFD